MIHIVIGTRAQLLKMTPIMQECEARGLAWRWIYAAQHKETFQQTLDFFRVRDPDYVVVRWDSEAHTMGKMWYWFSRFVLALPQSRSILGGHTGKSHILLTHGDTTTTFMGALIGRIGGTHVMHVESGLRSYNLLNPFPEEINRLITFRLSDYYACPGEWAMGNVKKLRGKKINTLENTQVDVLRYGRQNLHRATFLPPEDPYVVLSSHRYENVFRRERFEKIISAAEEAARRFKVVIPLHPVTASQLDKFELRERLERNKNVILTPRLEYQNYLVAISGAEFVMTDGGGNQEELYHLGKPTLILRGETERREGLGENAVLSCLDPETIRSFVAGGYVEHRRPATHLETSPAQIIVDAIAEFG